MDRINHVKMVTPDPEAVRRFLTEVLDVPDGWRLGSAIASPTTKPPSVGRDECGQFTIDGVSALRGASRDGGVVIGSTESRQFQVLRGDLPHIWSVAVGTRHLERAHERCVEAGIPCTELTLAAWGEAGIRFFFAEVGGLVFEVMRAEDAEV